MNGYESIHDIAMQLNLTSRTLRHWEVKGLIVSHRDPQSGWRLYDTDTVNRIRFALLLRELDIPIKDVKAILDSVDARVTAKILQKRLDKLSCDKHGIEQLCGVIRRCIDTLSTLPNRNLTDWVANAEKALTPIVASRESAQREWEGIYMINPALVSGALRIITLPPMRVAVCNVVSESPEDEALSTVLAWANAENLLGTARIFGFNTTEYHPDSKEYGWAACITIPEAITVPGNLGERRLPGGLYASLNSTNEVYDSWQTLMRLLSEHSEYEADRDRPCLEEHTQNGDSQGQEFHLTLLEPIRRK